MSDGDLNTAEAFAGARAPGALEDWEDWLGRQLEKPLAPPVREMEEPRRRQRNALLLIFTALGKVLLFQRAWLPLLAIAFLTVAALGTTVGVLVVWRHYSDETLRWTAVAGVSTGGAFVLAVFAGIIAAVAYLQSSRRPVLHAFFSVITTKYGPYFLVPVSEGQALNFKVGQDSELPPQAVSGAPRDALRRCGAQALHPEPLTFTLANEGQASARNVVVLLEFSGLFWWPTHDLPDGWRPDWQRGPKHPVTALRWEGGADYAIHSAGDKRYWDFDFTEVWTDPFGPLLLGKRFPPSISVTTVADGSPANRDRYSIRIEAPEPPASCPAPT
jgi:hypothetical protein